VHVHTRMLDCKLYLKDSSVSVYAIQCVCVSGPEVFFKTCVAMKFVDDDDVCTTSNYSM